MATKKTVKANKAVKAKKVVAKKGPAAKKPVASKSTAATQKPATTKRPTAKKKAAPKKRPAAKPSRRAAVDSALKLAGVGSEAVMKATGKAWEQWLAILDKAGAVKMPHKQIAQLLDSKFAVPGWWAQMLALGYEQARGLRQAYQKADGFAATASKTMNASLDRLYDAWHDSRLREFWLPGAPLDVRRSTDGKSMRITWTLGNSNVDVNFYAKGADKSSVHVEHSKLSDAETVAAQKAYWQEGLERLRTWLEAGRKK